MFLFPGLEKAECRVRAVLVGCGEQATNLIHLAISYLDEVEVVGVCDLNKERADFAARRFGLSRSWQDLDEMLEKVQAEVAFVVMVPAIQAKLALRCVEAGLHTYTEKPLGTELADIEALAAAAKRNDRKVGVSFNKRYAIAYQQMKAATLSEGFGVPAYLAKFIGGYRSTPTDLLRTGSIHFFDLARFLVGEVAELCAYRYEKAPGQHIFTVSMQFENGAVGSMTMGSLGSWINGYGMESVEIRGDRHMLSADNGRDFVWQKPAMLLSTHTQGNTQAVMEEAVPVEILRPNYSNIGKLVERDFYINGNYQCMKAFVRAVLDDTEPPVGIRDGIGALKIALAIEESVLDHRPVRLSEMD